MNKFSLSILFSSILLATAGCGGSGGSSSDSATPTSSNIESAGSDSTEPESTEPQSTESQTKSGKLLGLSGFSYESGSETGTTSDDGQFQYRTGQEVTFSLGGITLGSAAPSDYLTLEDIAGDHADALSNLQRFLVTVDYDLSPMNGIVVTSKIREAAEGSANLNFNQ